MKTLKSFLVAMVVCLFSFTGTSLAFAQASPDNGNILDLAKPVLDAVMGGRFAYAASLALVLLVALGRRYGVSRWKFLATDAGGSLLVLLGAFGGALATALAAGAGMSWGLLWAAVGVAVSASGGYTLVKRLVVDPLLRPLASKAPKWAQPLFKLLLWIFDNQSVAKAEAAGEAAVEAKPSAGLPTPNDLP